MNEIIDYLDDADCHTLIIFDVDMVLVQPSNPAFQMPNMKRYRTIAKRISQNLPKEKKEIFLTLMAMDSETILIDKKTPSYLNLLQKNNMQIIALTANLTGSLSSNSDLVSWKIFRLERLGIDFKGSSPFKEDICFTNLPSYRGYYSLCRNGILFSNGPQCSKGDVLIYFLQLANLYPSRIVFIDDREENLKNVEDSLKNFDSKIAFEGFHYTGASDYPSQIISEKEFEDNWSSLANKAMQID